MNIANVRVRFQWFTLIICLSYLQSASVALAATPLPIIIQRGFNSWSTKDASEALDVWKKGGLLETDGKPRRLLQYFNRLDRIVGGYRAYEIIETKRLSETSQIIYASINFERAAIYGRFLLYQAGREWVVQNMDFSPRPEVIMPWLAFVGENYDE